MSLTVSEKFNLRQKITDFAKSVGFDLVGFSPAKIEEKYLQAFEDWLKEGREGTMEYMRKIEQRRDLTKILPGAKTVIVFGMNYYHEQKSLKRGHGRIARYAYGRDYHKVIGKKLKMVEKFIGEIYKEIIPDSPEICARAQIYTEKTRSESHSASANQTCTPEPSHSKPTLTKSYVDTGPILERALAEQASIGRIGKNGCVISKEFGSWIFLSEIITTLDLNFEKVSSGTDLIPRGTQKSARAHSAPTRYFALNKTAQASHFDSDSPPRGGQDRWSNPAQKSFNVCGNCTRCMTACPTGAIIAPGVVDSRLCISYLTIENKDKIPPKLAKIIKKTKRLYGCDICQEVCPHNHARQRIKIDDAKTTSSPQGFLDGLLMPIAGDSLNIKKIPASDAAFLHTFAGSPIMRTKRRGLSRTAKIF